MFDFWIHVCTLNSYITTRINPYNEKLENRRSLFVFFIFFFFTIQMKALKCNELA